MIFDVYMPYTNKSGETKPGIKPIPMEWSRILSEVCGSSDVKDKIARVRAGEKDQKLLLPAICFVGRSVKTRAKRYMIPTQLVMIDIDHCKDARAAWAGIRQSLGNDWVVDNIPLAHISPSGEGLHLFSLAQEGFTTLQENMDALDERCNFQQYGDYDAVCHDFSRVSFAFTEEDILFQSARLLMNTPQELEVRLENPDFVNPDEEAPAVGTPAVDGKAKAPTTAAAQSAKPKSRPLSQNVPELTEEEQKTFDESEWRGVRLKTIVEAWVKFRGEPGPNEIHNYYNEMIKYFRNIMGNNKKQIFHLLPRFGHTAEECWSQIVSICRVNTLSSLDKEFYFFLKDNGFYTSNRRSKLDEYMLSDEEEGTTDEYGMPPCPPVIREFVKIAPKDFKVPMVNALMPVIGTLTSYLKAVYPYDNDWHTTSFFSIVYAPPSTGKGFVRRFKFLFDDLRLRDQVQTHREKIYLQVLDKKGDNERSPENPHTSLRIIPPKNSESEFLSKQEDNQGYHMFTYAAEMDSWAKGEKAAGGNKSDMIRIAWDNGLYGQQFKSASTFKGQVNLYWNVLITGTQAQVEAYFKNVENGLVTRCAFSGIENQEFQLAQKWGKISTKGMQVIRNFMRRCDENTYETPCNLTIDDINSYSDEEFEKEVDWRFRFRPRQEVNIDWIMPVIDRFQKEQCEMASLALDHARDVFRRRVGVRGFRLALMCTALYPKLNKKAVDTIKNFVYWWMHVDIENMLRLWGQKYNEISEVDPSIYYRNVYQELPETFTKNVLFVILRKCRIKSPVRVVVYRWAKEGFIIKTGKDEWKKLKKS